MATNPETGNSIGDLLRQLIEDVGHLFRTELRLAASEMRGNIAAMKGGAAAIATGGMLMLVALFTLVGAFVGWLTPVVGSAGLAAFIVAVATAVIGIVLMGVGSSKLKASSLAPDKTVASLRRDAETLKGN